MILPTEPSCKTCLIFEIGFPMEHRLALKCKVLLSQGVRIAGVDPTILGSKAFIYTCLFFFLKLESHYAA